MSVAESKTKALLDQGFAQTGVMLRKEDKACIVTDMGRVEWFQVNPWGGVQSNLVSLDTRNMRHVCQALQDGEITVSRAMECIEGIEAQTYTDDWLPKFQAFFGEELPIDAVKSAQNRIFDMLLGDDGQAWKEARKYIEKARPDLYRELQKRGAL